MFAQFCGTFISKYTALLALCSFTLALSFPCFLMPFSFFLTLLSGFVRIWMLHCDSSLDQRLYVSLTSPSPPYFFLGTLSTRILLIILPQHPLTPQANLTESFVFDLPYSSLDWSTKRLALSDAQYLSLKYPVMHQKLASLQRNPLSGRQVSSASSLYFNCKIGQANGAFISCAIGRKNPRWIVFSLPENQTVEVYQTWGQACCEKEPDFISSAEGNTFYLSQGGLLAKFKDRDTIGLQAAGETLRFCPEEASLHLDSNVSCSKTTDASLMTGLLTDDKRWLLFGKGSATVWIQMETPPNGSTVVKLEAVPVNQFFVVKGKSQLISDSSIFAIKNLIYGASACVVVLFGIFLVAFPVRKRSDRQGQRLKGSTTRSINSPGISSSTVRSTISPTSLRYPSKKGRIKLSSSISRKDIAKNTGKSGKKATKLSLILSGVRPGKG